ncbi:MAG: phosphohistidine swiveling domain-containing protein [Acidimicrobiales bacterium]|jgi:phosphohistidine swiveling domain-containing protein
MTTFEAPGAGHWDLDRSHYDGGMTRISAKLMADGPRNAYRKLFHKFGVPAETVDVQIVQGFIYSRIRPLVGPDLPATKAPPVWVVKLLGRLHPELRRRAKAAQQTLDNPGWAEVAAEWRSEIKPRLVARNLELQGLDLAVMSNAELADHLDVVLTHVAMTFEEHHRLHGYDLGPLGQLVVAGRDWGIATSETLAALVGASPTTTAPRAEAAKIRAAVLDVDGDLASLESMREASPEARRLLDAYIERHGSLLYSSYDIDSPTLVERPEVLARSIRHAQPPVDVASGASAVVDKIRQRIPAEDLEEFDHLLEEARAAMDMRDDNGPITVEWPAGLLRLAMIEAGRRLCGAGRIPEVDLIFELEVDELAAIVRDGSGPGRAELKARAAERAQQKLLDPPLGLGPPEPPPVLEALPTASATLIRIVNAVSDELLTAAVATAGPDAKGALSGTGIGSDVFIGLARTAATATDAIASLEPGEVLVTRNTSPAYNLILSLAGGLVTETGGAMCHAAVLSRELGLPAVIGAPGCLEAIQTGDRVELDPLSGTVRIIR